MSIISRHKPADSRIERRIITAMITSTEYLTEVQQIYRSESLRLKYTKVVADWCLEYWEQYKQAPKQHIEDIFHKRTKINFPSDQANDIEQFLSDISEEYETADRLNIEYLLSQTEEYFRLTNLDNIRVKLNKSIVSGDAEEGEQLIKGYERIVRDQTRGIDIFTDIDTITASLDESKKDQNTILQYPGALGEAIGPLEREYFVAIVANTGVGKSWWLSQSAWWSVINGYDVLYVSYEMAREQIAIRTYMWATGLPKRKRSVIVPVWDCKKNQSGECKIKEKRENEITIVNIHGEPYMSTVYPDDYKPCSACKDSKRFRNQYDPTSYLKTVEKEALTLPRALKMRDALSRYKRAGQFRFIRWPAGKKSIDDLNVFLQNLEDYEGFIPDLIITDPAYKMKSSSFYREKRHTINDIFIEHKALAQERHCLVITAHQGNTVRDGKDLKRGSWQEAIGGLNEVDVSFMVNESPTDKKLGLQRILTGKKRDDEYDLVDQVYVQQCLSIGRPYLDSWKG